MPEVLSTSPFTPFKLQQAVEQELKDAPENALTASVTYLDHGTLKSTVAVRITRERWVLGVGGFVEAPKDAAPTWGAFGTVSVKF